MSRKSSLATTQHIADLERVLVMRDTRIKELSEDRDRYITRANEHHARYQKAEATVVEMQMKLNHLKAMLHDAELAQSRLEGYRDRVREQAPRPPVVSGWDLAKHGDRSVMMCHHPDGPSEFHEVPAHNRRPWTDAP